MTNTTDKELTSEEKRQLELERLEKMRPMDDILMRELFRNNIPLAQFVLRIMTGKEDLVIISEETQYDLKHLLGAKSICLDVLATDSEGRKLNLEVQRFNKGATPKRARYHSSSLDIEFLEKNQDFEQLPTTYVIFITENDVRKSDRPAYIFERKDTVTGEPFGDDEYIIFINGAYHNPDDNSDIARLIHDFRCNKAEDMYFDIIAEKTNYYKKTQKGVDYMCEIIEDMLNDEKIRFAVRLLKRGKDTIEEISELTGLSVEKVEEIAEELKPASA